MLVNQLIIFPCLQDVSIFIKFQTLDSASSGLSSDANEKSSSPYLNMLRILEADIVYKYIKMNKKLLILNL
jgi:hypothetical protein